MVFRAPEEHPTPEAERARYLLHRNDPRDAGYRSHLARLVEPLVERLSPGMEGLDYGCGPGPTLSLMLEERGFRMRLYDPCFHPDRSALERDYDFITSTETAEHFREPAREFERLDALLRPGGWLGLTTRMLGVGRSLAGWWYAEEATHLCFYSHGTMKWIARRNRWRAAFPRADVVLFEKRATARSERRLSPGSPRAPRGCARGRCRSSRR